MPISLPIILLSPDSLESLYKLFAFLRNNRHTSSSKLAQWCFLVSLVMLVHHLFVTYPNVSIGNYCAVFCVHLSNFGWISRLQCFVLFLCYYSSPAKKYQAIQCIGKRFAISWCWFWSKYIYLWTLCHLQSFNATHVSAVQ